MLSTFFAMGGYAAYVWPAYMLALGVVLVNILSTRHQAKQVRHSLHERRQREDNI